MKSREMSEDKEFVDIDSLKSVSSRIRHQLNEIGAMLGEISNQTKALKEKIKDIEKPRKGKGARTNLKKDLTEKFHKLCADLAVKRLRGSNWKSYWVDGRESLSIEKLLENGVPPHVIEASKVKAPGYRVVVGIDDDGDDE